MTEKISLNNKAEPRVNEVVNNIWGSWQKLYQLTKKALREYQENNKADMIGKKQFFKYLIGNQALSRGEYVLARRAIKTVLQRVKEDVLKTQQLAECSLRRLVDEAKEWQKKELERSGGIDPNEI